MKKLRLFVATVLAAISIVALQGCSSSIERNIHTSAVVSHSAVKEAYDGWVKDFVRRAQPYVVVENGRKRIDYTQAPELLAEKQKVAKALSDYKGSSTAIVDALVAIKSLDGPNEARLIELEVKISEAAIKLISIVKGK